MMLSLGLGLGCDRMGWKLDTRLLHLRLSVRKGRNGKVFELNLLAVRVNFSGAFQVLILSFAAVLEACVRC